MANLSVSELTGLLDSICLDRGRVPAVITNNELYDRDALASAGVKNRIHLSPTGFGAEIAKHLRHIPVNPHNVVVSELIRRSYVHRSKGGRANAGEELIINESEVSLFVFMSTVIRAAKYERMLSMDVRSLDATIESLFANCVHVIHGERGVGKTFFLNYALTRCNDILDKRKTIWVRLNFVYSSGFEDDIEYWMHAQATKIILRYYDKKSGYEGKRIVSAADYLFGWIRTNDRLTDADKVRMRSALRSMEQVFCHVGEDESVRPSLCDRELCRELYRFMRAEGWSFIFVLDGFDQLDISPEQVHRFETIRSSVQRFISMRATFGAAVIVVTRSHTFDDLKSYDPFKGIPETRKFRVAEVNFERVVRQRFEAIKEVVIGRIPYHRLETAEKLGETITIFMKTVLTPSALIAESEKFDGANIRAKLQRLYLLFLDFVDESTGKGYLILEHMLLNGLRYPAIAYDYVETTKGELSARSDELMHEARFLPLITRYPLPSVRAGFVPPKNGLRHLLLGVRVLQLSIAARELLKDQELLSIGELMSILTACFSYMPMLQSGMIVELSAFDLLRVIRNEGLPVNSNSNRIIALPKSDYLLTESLRDVAYLNMCAMRTALPKTFYNQRFVQCAFLGVRDHDAHAWVESKIVNALSLFCILVLQNRVERTNFNPRSAESLPDRERAVWNRALGNGLWDLIPDARQQVGVEVMQILTSGPIGWLTTEDKETIADRVRRMFAYWRQRGPLA